MPQHKLEHIILIILLIIAAFGSFFVYFQVSAQKQTIIQQQETINNLTRQIATFSLKNLSQTSTSQIPPPPSFPSQNLNNVNLNNVTSPILDTSNKFIKDFSNNYVKLLNSSTGQELYLQFLLPVIKKDINKTNVKVCVSRASVGKSMPRECTDKKYSWYIGSDDIFLNYNEKEKLLIIKTEKSDFTGCAACAVEIELNNIHSEDGTVLPKKVILVDNLQL